MIMKSGTAVKNVKTPAPATPVKAVQNKKTAKPATPPTYKKGGMKGKMC